MCNWRDFLAAYRKVCCSQCQHANVKKNGKTRDGQQRYLCQNNDCSMKTFLLSEDYVYKGCSHYIEPQIISQTLRASGIRDVAHNLGISCGKVIKTIKAQSANIRKSNWKRLSKSQKALLLCVHTQLDEQWSFVGSKANQRWLWVALCQYTGQVLAFTFGKRTNHCCGRLLKLLKPFNIKCFSTDDWHSYRACIEAGLHKVCKRFTQKVERFFLTLRTHIKRLVRKSICFSKSELMHDTVIGLYINKNYF